MHAATLILPTTPRRPARRSQRLVSELLALNEEMILKFGVERREDTCSPALLTIMIRQHERAAARLRREIAETKSSGQR